MSSPSDDLPEHTLDIFVWVWWLFIKAVWRVDLNNATSPDELRDYLSLHEPQFSDLSWQWHESLRTWIAEMFRARIESGTIDLSADARLGEISLGPLNGVPEKMFDNVICAISPVFVESTRKQLLETGGFLPWVKVMRRGIEKMDTETESGTPENLKVLWTHRFLLSRALRLWESDAHFLVSPLVAPSAAINTLYMEWLQAHPDAIEEMAWDAFEQVVSEVFRSFGFKVELTARVRGKSADIIGLHTCGAGISTKYLIECKRYRKNRRVGLAAINAVIGATQRADADHAILVTTSSFTREVLKRKPELEDLRLHLRSGDDIREWLRDYKSNPTQGFRLLDQP